MNSEINSDHESKSMSFKLQHTLTGKQVLPLDDEELMVESMSNDLPVLIQKEKVWADALSNNESDISSGALMKLPELNKFASSPQKTINKNLKETPNSPLRSNGSIKQTQKKKKVKWTNIESKGNLPIEKDVNTRFQLSFKNQLQRDQELAELQLKKQNKAFLDKVLSQIKYPEKSELMFPSLKQVLRNRPQFSQKMRQKVDELRKEFDLKLDSDKVMQQKQAKIKIVLAHDKSGDCNHYHPCEESRDSKYPRNSQPVFKRLGEWFQIYRNNIKTEDSFYINGQIYKHTKLSLGIFDNRSKLRVVCMVLVKSKYFNNFIIFMIFLNSVLLGIKDYGDKLNKSTTNQILEQYMENVFFVTFLLECLIKVIALGLIFDKNTYLSDYWNLLDFTVVITSILESINTIQNLSGMRTFRLFRPLRNLQAMPSMKLLVSTLFKSFNHLGGILGLSVFFFSIFAILGVWLWEGLINNRCYAKNSVGQLQIVRNDTQLCSDFRKCADGQICYNATMWKLVSEETVLENSNVLDLNYGLTNFNNVFYAFLTIFQCITQEGWGKIVNIYIDVYQSAVVYIYFTSVVVICSFFLLNMTIAVMLIKYQELYKNQQQTSKSQLELRNEGKLINLPSRLTEWLIKSEQSVNYCQDVHSDESSEDQTCQENKPPGSHKFELKKSLFEKLFKPQKITINKKDKYYQNPLVKVCFNIIKSSYFEAFIILMILFNTLTLTFDGYPPPSKTTQRILSQLNQIFTLIFFIEMVLKLIALGVRPYLQDKFNIFDLIIVFMSVMQLTIQSGSSNIFSAGRAVRLFKVVKIIKIGNLAILIESITFTISSIGDYVLLLIIFIYIFSLLGMSLFVGQLKFNNNDEYDQMGEPAKSNFDTILQAFLSTLQIILGGEWNRILYDCIRSAKAQGNSDYQSSIYFFLLVLMGQIIMLNLFLAILLGNFEKARTYKIHKNLVFNFKELKEEGLTLSQSIDVVYSRKRDVIKKEILLWQEHIVDLIAKEGETQLAQQLLEDGVKFMKECYIIQSHLNKVHFNFKHRMVFDKAVVAEVLYLHNQGNRLKRQSEMSQLYRIEPRPDLKRILEKDNIDIDLSEDLDIGADFLDNRVANLIESLKVHFSGQYFCYQLDKNKLDSRIINFNIQANQIQQKLKLQNLHSLTFSPNKSWKRSSVQSRGTALEKIICIILEWPLVDENEQYQNRFKHLSLDKQSLAALFIEQYKPPPPQRIVKLIEFPIESSSDDEIVTSQDQDKDEEEEKEISIEDHDLVAELSQKTQLQFQTKCNVVEQEKINKLQTFVKKRQNLSQTPTIKSIKKRNSQSAVLTPMNRSMSLNKNQRTDSIRDLSRSFSVKHEPAHSNNNETSILRDHIKDLRKQNQPDKQSLKKKSCFIFSQDGCIRRYCLMLTEDTQMYNRLNQGQQECKSHNQSSKLRRRRTFKEFATQKVTANSVFENLVIFMIVISSIVLVVDSPLNDPKDLKTTIIYYIDSFSTVFFLIEALIKIISKGFIWESIPSIQPYLAQSWNRLDLFVVLASLINLLFDIIGINMSQFGSLKALRALRGLRPLRVISKNEGLRLVVNALFSSMPAMFNVLIICFLFILIFAIIGMNFFKGSFASCIKIEQSVLAQVSSMQDCLNLGGTWQIDNQNFDRLDHAMLNLFIMTNKEAWVEVMHRGLDSTGIGMQPKNKANLGMCVFFIAFMIIGSQFVLNLFAGVVIDNFNIVKEQEELGNSVVNEQQKNWIELQKLALGRQLHKRIQKPTGLRKYFYLLVRHKKFDNFINLVILFNTVIMAIKHSKHNFESRGLDDAVVDYTNTVCTLIFNIEMVFKIIGLGKGYLYDNWNIFDFCIMLGCDIGQVLEWTTFMEADYSTVASVMRGFRMLRMVKLLGKSDNIKVIIDTIINIMPQVLNVMLLMILMIFIYSCFAINLFSGVIHQEVLNSKSNFSSFSGSMLLLLVISTGESWSKLMFELANQDGYQGQKCVDNSEDFTVYQKNLACGTRFSYLFFLSFQIVVSLMLMNLAIAAVIEGLQMARKEHKMYVRAEEIDFFNDLWLEYDPEVTKFITVRDLVFLLYELPPPLGVKSLKCHGPKDWLDTIRTRKIDKESFIVNIEKEIVLRKIDALDLIQDLKIVIYENGKLHYVDVIKQLLKRVFKNLKISTTLDQNLKKKMKKHWNQKHLTRVKTKSFRLNNEEEVVYTIHHEHAALIITKWAKNLLEKHRQYEANLKNRGTALSMTPKLQKEPNGLSGPTTRNQDLKQISKKIWKMINNEEDYNRDNTFQKSHYKVQNTYSWMTKQGQIKMSEQVDRELNKKDDQMKQQLDISKQEKSALLFSTPHETAAITPTFTRGNSMHDLEWQKNNEHVEANVDDNNDLEQMNSFDMLMGQKQQIGGGRNSKYRL